MTENVENVDFTDIYVDEDIIDDVIEVLESKRYIKGPEVRRFEDEFARKAGTEFAVAVANGTAALLLSLQAAGIGEGDDVFVPGHTFFATVSPLLALDSNPIFVEIDEKSYTLDPIDLRRKVENSDNPRGILPVHIYGHMADMAEITDVADEFDLKIVEDACQAHFAERGGDIAGTVGDAGAFSFYPSKNMTVGGDGGMIITDNEDIAEAARELRNHGRNPDGEHVRLGLNYRLDEVRAAVGRQQLRHIEDWNTQRNDAAELYKDRLSSVPEVVLPKELNNSRHVYHLFVVQVPDRDGLRNYLDEHGVDTGVHYPVPAHQHTFVIDQCGESALSFTEQLCNRILSLPMHPRLDEQEIDYVCEKIEEYYE